MNGLETKLDPEKFITVFFLQAREQCQYLRSQAVRSRGDGDTADVRMIQGRTLDLFQIRERCVTIGICLKISDQILSDGFIAEIGNAFRNLFFHRFAEDVYGKIAAAAATTEDTAPSVQGAVPIGTGHPGIQGYFITFMVKRIFRIGIQRVVGLTVPVSCYVCPLQQ